MELPDKVYFRIGEVAKALDVQPHVIRFWQQQFPTVKPERSKTGRFLYTRKNVEQFERIQRLLKKEGFTIAGARKALRHKDEPSEVAEAVVAPAIDDAALAALRKQLADVTADRDDVARRLTVLRGAVMQHTGAALRELDRTNKA